MVCSIDLKYYEILQFNFCCFSSVTFGHYNSLKTILFFIIININTTSIDCLWIVTHIRHGPYGRHQVVPFHYTHHQHVSVACSHKLANPAFCLYRQGKLVNKYTLNDDDLVLIGGCLQLSDGCS